MEGLHSYSVRLLLFVSFCVVQFEVIQALNDSSAHIANTSSSETKACLNGSCSRAASDDEDKSGFIHSVWAIFLFSLLGIIAFVAFLILVLRVLCTEKQKGPKPDTEQIIPPKSTFRDTPGQREIIPAQNPTYEEEAQIDELYAKPHKNFRGDNFQPQNAGLQYQTPPPQPYPPQNENPPFGYPRNIEVEPISPNSPAPSSPYYPATDDQTSQYYGYGNGPMPQPYQYLDKYNPSQGTVPEQPTAPPRAVLRNSTPYQVVEEKAHLSEEYLDAPEAQQHHVRFDSPSPPPPPMHSHLPTQQPMVYEGPSRFVRVLPRAPPVPGALKPSPVFRRKF